MRHHRTIRKVFVRGGCGFGESVNITNEGIMEVYPVLMEARAAGQSRIPVYVFPTRMTGENLKKLYAKAGRKKKLRRLYQQLEAGYTRFGNTHLPLDITIDKAGNYAFGNSQSVTLSAQQ
jgi:murein L,D-transpeptidase YafK